MTKLIPFDEVSKLCRSGAFLGRSCPACDGPMVICEKDKRYMMCERDAGCSFLIEKPPLSEFLAAALGWVAVTTNTGKKYKGLVLYRLSGMSGLFVRGHAVWGGRVTALRFTKRTFGPEVFCEVSGRFTSKQAARYGTTAPEEGTEE